MLYNEIFIKNLTLLTLNYMCFTSFIIIFLYYIQKYIVFLCDILKKNIKRNEICSI
jgi:hypothetical protein